MAKLQELYRFTEGAQVWTVTSTDGQAIFASELYTPIAIGRDEIESKNELSKANLTVTVGIDNVMARRWLRTSVDTSVRLTLYIQNNDDFITFPAWKGRLSSTKPMGKSIQLVFESIFTSLRRPGLRQHYQRTCPHVLYGAGCKVNRESYGVLSTVTSVSGTTIIATQAASYPDGWFQAGMMLAPDGSGTYRFIVSHKGSELKLIRPFAAMEGAVAVFIYPGCDRSLVMCKDKFDNILNNGSFPYIPLKNPFGGSSIV